MSTAEVGNRVGYSTQQVRDLERLGVIPSAERTPSGYRLYRLEHVEALHAYRSLAVAAGPVRARTLMPLLLASPLVEAAAIVDDLHSELAGERAAVVDARRGLLLIRAEVGDVFDGSRDSMTISELATALGVRPSTLRHWENESLVRPERVGSTRARCYSWQAIIDARIVAALRAGGHRIPTIAAVLERVRDYSAPSEADALLTDRLQQLAQRSVALLEASASIHRLIRRPGAENDR
jgi:DNA-binding transcriptional MerR regulator